MTNSTEFHNAILAANETFMSTFTKGDATGMAALYTESSQFLPPNSEFVTGKEAIQALFQGFMDMGVKVINLETIETEEYGNTGLEIGKYTLEVDEGQVIDRGKYMVIWKNESGQWKLHRDIINTSMPASK